MEREKTETKLNDFDQTALIYLLFILT